MVATAARAGFHTQGGWRPVNGRIVPLQGGDTDGRLVPQFLVTGHPSTETAKPEIVGARRSCRAAASWQNSGMRIEEHIAALRHEGELLAKAAEVVEPGAAVPTCPEWTVRELIHHVGRTHRWAARFVRDARPTPTTPEEDEQTWGAMPQDSSLVAWFRNGHVSLVETLEAAPPDVACWSFLPAPSPLAFWARRQAHETAIHRADAQSVLGDITGYAAGFSEDGIDELLLCFFSRARNRVRSDPVRTLAVTATDVDAAWLVHIGPDGARAQRGAGTAECGLRGPVSDLYLGLWNRRAVDDLEISGDQSLLALWRERATIRWS